MGDKLYHEQVDDYTPHALDRFVLILASKTNGVPPVYLESIDSLETLKEIKDFVENKTSKFDVYGCVLKQMCSEVNTGLLTFGPVCLDYDFKRRIFFGEPDFRKYLESVMGNDPQKIDHYISTCCSASLVRILE